MDSIVENEIEGIGRNFFIYERNNVIYHVPYNFIVYFRLEDRKICLAKEKDTINDIALKMSDIEKDVPNYFVKVSHTLIVNAYYIERIHNADITLSTKELFGISRKYKKDAMAKFSRIYNKDKV